MYSSINVSPGLAAVEKESAISLERTEHQSPTGNFRRAVEAIAGLEEAVRESSAGGEWWAQRKPCVAAVGFENLPGRKAAYQVIRLTGIVERI